MIKTTLDPIDLDFELLAQKANAVGMSRFDLIIAGAAKHRLDNKGKTCLERTSNMKPFFDALKED